MMYSLLTLWSSGKVLHLNQPLEMGKLFARGVADNKGNLIARIKAVESILKTKGESSSSSEIPL